MGYDTSTLPPPSNTPGPFCRPLLYNKLYYYILDCIAAFCSCVSYDSPLIYTLPRAPLFVFLFLLFLLVSGFSLSRVDSLLLLLLVSSLRLFLRLFLCLFPRLLFCSPLVRGYLWTSVLTIFVLFFYPLLPVFSFLLSSSLFFCFPHSLLLRSRRCCVCSYFLLSTIYFPFLQLVFLLFLHNLFSCFRSTPSFLILSFLIPFNSISLLLLTVTASLLRLNIHLSIPISTSTLHRHIQLVWLFHSFDKKEQEHISTRHSLRLYTTLDTLQ